MNHVIITNVEHNRYARNQYDNFISNVIILFIISLVMVINIQGIFKTVLYTRRKEIGIRRSLGATKLDIFLLIQSLHFLEWQYSNVYHLVYLLH